MSCTAVIAMIEHWLCISSTFSLIRARRLRADSNSEERVIRQTNAPHPHLHAAAAAYPLGNERGKAPQKD